jgi:2-polyprenyl-3-methyl-5-hydroxy-6-metoxy-1,4-benzoquinol methylase
VTGYEYRRFAPGESVVSTFEFHKHRERAPHIDQPIHQPRLNAALDLVCKRWLELTPTHRTVIADLGCGDGGLLQQIRHILPSDIDVYGYDFQPSNVDGWRERDLLDVCQSLNVVKEWDRVVNADIYVATEVLEHLEEPYDLLRKIRQRGASLVCSSPWMEHEGNIDACHNWAWDMPGYVSMLEECGFRVVESRHEGIFQVHLAVPA